MAMEAAQIRAAAAAAQLRTSTLCAALADVLALLDEIQAATPGWHVWRSAPVAVAISVLHGVQEVLCGGGDAA